MLPLERPIGDGDRVLFMHVPKTAGTSLIQVIEQEFDEPEIARWLYSFHVLAAPPDFFPRHRYFHGHVEYWLMRRFLPGEPIALTMLREPVERYLSDYGNHRRALLERLPRTTPEVYTAFHATPLDQFVEAPPTVLAGLSRNLRDLQTKMLATDHDPRELGQVDRLIETGGYVFPDPDLEAARRRLEVLAFVGLTERFQESLFLLAYTFGWRPAMEYPYLNVSPGRPRRDGLPPDLRERLDQANRLDLEVYRHGQRMFEARYERMIHQLLERHGRKGDARRKLPLPAEMVADLLEAHYRERFVERHPAGRVVKIGFDQKLSGSGWHTRESDPVHGPFRWSGPGRRSTLDLPIGAAGAVWLRFSVAMTITDGVLAGLQVKVNGAPVRLERRRSASGATVCEGRVPKGVLARRPGCARVTFEVAQTVVPRMQIPGSVDDRPVGIALSWLRVEPALPREDRVDGAGAPSSSEVEVDAPRRSCFLRIPKRAGATLTRVLEAHIGTLEKALNITWKPRWRR